MMRPYSKPVLTKRDALSLVAGGPASPPFNGNGSNGSNGNN